MLERGAREEEVIFAIEKGEFEPARRNRKLFRKNFQLVADEGDKIVVVTVYVFYF